MTDAELMKIKIDVDKIKHCMIISEKYKKV